MNSRVAKTNFDYCKETLELKLGLENKYLELAMRLHKIFNERMYEPNYETFGDFIEELKMSRSKGSALVNIWQRLVVDWKIKKELISNAGGWTKVYEFLPLMKNKDQAVAWLQKSKDLSQSDIRKEKQEAKTGIPMATCKHPDYVIFRRCVACGDTERIYDDDKTQ